MTGSKGAWRCPHCGCDLGSVPIPRCVGCDWVIEWPQLRPRMVAELASRVPFKAEFAGVLAPQQVEAAWNATEVAYSQEVRNHIERHWEDRRAQAGGALLYNGSLARLNAWRFHEGRLTLLIGPTDYRSFLATNFCPADRREQLEGAILADPLGVSAVVVTADGHLVWGRRRKDSVCHGGYLHAIGGMLEMPGDQQASSLDVFAAMQAELIEELQIKPAEITELVCIGLVRDGQVRQPELVFEVTLTLTRQQLLDRFDPAARDQEHVGFETCLDLTEAVVPFIHESQPMASVAVGALMLHGRHHWGSNWYEHSGYVLFGDRPAEPLVLAAAASV